MNYELGRMRNYVIIGIFLFRLDKSTENLSLNMLDENGNRDLPNKKQQC
jgi:hypothetical protein